MSLALAIQKNAAPLGSAQATYKQEVIAVATQMTSVLTSNLPTLNQSPPDLQSYISTLEDAKGDALDWVNVVLARLLNVPGEIRTYQDSVAASLADALTQSSTLVQNPGDSRAAATLQADLTNLQTTLSVVTTFVDSAVNAIKSFGDKLPKIAVDLESIATSAAADAKADQQQIDQLNDRIDDLRENIKDLTVAIVGLATADGVLLTLGVATTIAGFPEGALVWFVLGPAIAVATTFIALDAEKIKADKAQIQELESQIQGVTADAATLQILARNFSGLATGTTVVASSLDAVLTMWEALRGDAIDALADIKFAIESETSDSFSRVRADLAQAQYEWNQLYALAGNLHLDLKVNTARLQLGFSKSQVQAAAAKGKVVDVIEYYNALGT